MAAAVVGLIAATITGVVAYQNSLRERLAALAMSNRASVTEPRPFKDRDAEMAGRIDEVPPGSASTATDVAGATDMMMDAMVMEPRPFKDRDAEMAGRIDEVPPESASTATDVAGATDMMMDAMVDATKGSGAASATDEMTDETMNREMSAIAIHEEYATLSGDEPMASPNPGDKYPVMFAPTEQSTPSEPVYEGRTLRQWQSQMRFEQEPTTRRDAATRVLMLCKTVADQDAFEVASEAAGFFYRDKLTNDVELDAAVEAAFHRELPSAKEFLMAARRAGPAAASELLQQRLKTTEPLELRTALYLVALLNWQIREDADAWLGLVEQIPQVTRQGSATLQNVGRSIGAAICPDSQYAEDHLIGSEVDNASVHAIRSWIQIAKIRKMEIPTETGAAWLARYFKLSDNDDDFLYYFDTPQHGPLVGISWQDVEPSYQEVLNLIADELAKDIVGHSEVRSEVDEKTQIAIESRNLCRLVRSTNFDGDLRNQIVDALSHRLAQVLRIRGRQSHSADSPADIGEAFLLLTGTVPEILKIRTPGISLPKSILNPSGLVSALGRSGSASEQILTVTRWYPYDGFDLLAERNFTSPNQRSFRTVMQATRRELKGFSELLFCDFLLEGQHANANNLPNRYALFRGYDLSSVVVGYMQKYPEFRRLMRQCTDTADSSFVEESADILAAALPETEFADAMLAWLRNDNPSHRDVALRRLWELDENRFQDQWGAQIGESIASRDLQLSSRQGTLIPLFFLDKIGRHAAPAVDPVIRLVSELANRDTPVEKIVIQVEGLNDNALVPVDVGATAMRILLRFPEKSAVLLPTLEQLPVADHRAFDPELLKKLIAAIKHAGNEPSSQ